MGQSCAGSPPCRTMAYSFCLTLQVLVASTVVVLGQQAPQYHIQTDQGADRFFRFQTASGQYRKEVRHEDGSQEGTYGWVDPNGVLRLFDYVADNLGYRIVQVFIKCSIMSVFCFVQKPSNIIGIQSMTCIYYDLHVRRACSTLDQPIRISLSRPEVETSTLDLRFTPWMEALDQVEGLDLIPLCLLLSCTLWMVAIST